MKNSTSAKTHEIPFPWLYGTGGTTGKINSACGTGDKKQVP